MVRGILKARDIAARRVLIPAARPAPRRLFISLSMPELPEVEITRQKLLPLVRGRKILNFWTDWARGLKNATPAAVRKDIAGRKILNLSRRGKVLFFKLSGMPPTALAIHFRMSGRLEVVSTQGAVKVSKRSRWVHFVWHLSGGKELRFIDPRKFGVVWYGGPAFSSDPYLSSLGPDAKNLSRATFARAIRKRSGAIKPLLLRQDVISGIGNILADESLWRARIHPRTRIENLSSADANRLHGALSQTIRVSLAFGGSTLRDFRHPDGMSGMYQEQRRVYGKAGAPCPRCGVTLERIIVGGRGTTVCPRCQN